VSRDDGAQGFKSCPIDPRAITDLVSIRGRRAALAEIDLCVGDGAAIMRSIVRQRNGVRIGHASVRAEFSGAASEEVERAIFSHCGSEIVRRDEVAASARVRELGEKSAFTMYRN
jgi:hypothetical protein